jgi:hypothetical protein
MSPKESKQLATRVAKESDNVVVRFGKTNGRHCLHLNDTKPKDASRSSFTIFNEQEWAESPYNHANRPRKAKRVDPDIAAAVANKEAV